jgi:K+-sensing histidine kinase KdpD
MANVEKQEAGKKPRSEDQDIHLDNEILQSEQRVFLPALVGVSRRLLTSTASIKAAVSSLLFDDILWDPINQHEFLEIINDSTDQLSDLLTLVLLTLRAEANLIVLHPEPYLMEEILGKVKQQITAQFPKFDLEINIPEDHEFIYTDFDYLVLLLELLIQVINTIAEVKSLHLQTIENNDHFSLVFRELDKNTFQRLQDVLQFKLSEQATGTGKKLSSEALLKVQLVRHILKIQEISSVFEYDAGQGISFHLDIPIHKKDLKDLPENH